jgi:hypothetical protein
VRFSQFASFITQQLPSLPLPRCFTSQMTADRQRCPRNELSSNFMNSRPTGFYFLTPVWGESYTKTYIETVIPAQLAPGNLPALRSEPGCRYIIYTTPEDAERIRSSNVFDALSACMPLSFEWITDRINVVHDTMTDCFRRGIAAAESAGAAVLFLTPDLVFADGSFAAIKKLSNRGRDVVFIPGIRTIKFGVSADLQAFRHNCSIEVSPRELMRIAFDNLHPLADSSWWDEGDGNLIPANLYWRVANEGIVGRCFHLHPVFVNSQRKNVTFFSTVDGDYIAAACPDDSHDYVVTNSDEISAVELSDPDRFFEMGFSKGSVKEVIRWAELFTDKRHRKLFDETIRMHSGISDVARWTETERRAADVAREIQKGLNTRSWRLIFDADMLVRRLIRRAKNYQLDFANSRRAEAGSGGSAPAWRLATIGIVKHTISARHRLMNWLRQLVLRIEVWVGYPYQLKVARDLARLLPRSSNIVLITNSPGKLHLSRWLMQSSPSFQPNRYFCVARQDKRVFFEKDQPIAEHTMELVVLELDAFRTENISKYLDEASRVLRDNGNLLVYLHRLSVAARPPNEHPLKTRDLIQALSHEFDIVDDANQGGLGSHIRVEFSIWLGEFIIRRPLARWTLQIIFLPLSPVLVVLGGLAVLLTFLVDLLDWSERFRISSLVLARRRP